MEDRRAAKKPPQLSCELCKERKVKCDKQNPCTNCTSAGTLCVPIFRMRLPRGRHARSRNNSDAKNNDSASNDVNERLRKLEALLDGKGSSSRQSPVPQPVESSTQGLRVAPASPSHRSVDMSGELRRQAPIRAQSDDFWTNLVEETQPHELRGVIAPSPGDANEAGLQLVTPSRTNSTDSGISLLGMTGIGNLSQGLPRLPQDAMTSSLSKPAASQLCQVYLQQVDPVIKFLHRPSLSVWMLNGGSYLDYPQGHPSTEALRSAVCYAAVCSLTEAQAQNIFQCGKTDMTGEYRRACEASMERTGLLATKDVTVLQAFVLYLVGMKSEDRSGSAVWALIALAVRLAKSLCIHTDPDVEGGWSETFFEQQMRKRLWLTVCLLDLQASFGQASEPLITHDEVVSALSGVKHINDSDIDPTTPHEVPDREGLTDTTFALVTYHAQSAGRALNFVTQPSSSDAGPSPHVSIVVQPGQQCADDVELRQQQSRQFEQRALQLLNFCDPESSQYAWFCWHGTVCLVNSMRISSLRPLKRARRNAQPSQFDRSAGDAELLRLSLRVLEKAQLIHTDPRGEGWKWYVTVPWLALAIAIAECYVCTDVDLLRQAWPLVEASYQHHEAATTPRSGDKLSGPLAKLKLRASEKLTPLLADCPDMSKDQSSSTTGSQPTALPTPSTVAGDFRMESIIASTLSPLASDISFGATYFPSTQMLPQQMWSPTSLFSDSQSVVTSGVSAQAMSSSLPSQNLLEPSWSAWDDFISGITLDEYASNPTLNDIDCNFGNY